MLKVTLTQRAQTSLEEITDYYLTEHTEQRAVKVIESIDAAFEKNSRCTEKLPRLF